MVGLFRALSFFFSGFSSFPPSVKSTPIDISKLCAPWSNTGRMAAACGALSKPSTGPR